MHRRKRWLRSPRLRAKWRRGFNKRRRQIVRDGLTKRRAGLLFGYPEQRRCWTTFVRDELEFFALND